MRRAGAAVVGVVLVVVAACSDRAPAATHTVPGMVATTESPNPDPTTAPSGSVAPPTEPTTTEAPLTLASLRGRLAVVSASCDDTVPVDDGGGYVLCVVNPDGSGARQVAGLLYPERAQWSPDGARLMYLEDGEEPGTVVVVDVDGGARTALTDRATWLGFEWSPDASQLLLQGYETLLVDGARPTSGDIGADEGRVLFDRGLGDVAWSPDGSRVVFSWDDSPQGSRMSCSTIQVIDVATLERVQLTPPPLPEGEGTVCAVDPRWSPDGSLIAFGLAELEVDGQPSQVMLVPADGGGLRPVSPEGVDADPLSWSPDGRYLAYRAVDRSTGTVRVVVTSRDGSQTVDLPLPTGLLRWTIAIDWTD